MEKINISNLSVDENSKFINDEVLPVQILVKNFGRASARLLIS